LCGRIFEGDALRYDSKPEKPVVVWNVTQKCNLFCRHCYSNSSMDCFNEDLSTGEAARFIRGLHKFSVPVLLFSGGEPLLRSDIYELGEEAKTRGIRTVISTNGTLITKNAAKKIRNSGFDYVGVSFDGVGASNDMFRGKSGAFKMALAGIRNLRDAGQKTGIRFTITRHNSRSIKDIFELAERENVDRVCFYHLVYTGRGNTMISDDLDNNTARAVVDSIMQWALSLHERGMRKEVLSVDNHADGVYLYLKTLGKDPGRAREILRLLESNGGNSSGASIACVDNKGEVHADQFLRSQSFGNVKDRDFGDIWTDPSIELLHKLKNRRSFLKGRCSRCRHVAICNGNFRARAEAIHKDIWQEDPACYLTDKEISQ